MKVNGNIEMTPVVSSQINSIGYSEVYRTLYVKFSKGSIYRYFDVEKDVYQEFVNSESPGKYFHAHIRKEYSYELVETQPEEEL